MGANIRRVTGSSKTGKQFRSQTQSYTKPERNKYAKKPTVSAAELATWNAEIERKKQLISDAQWRWEMNAAGDSMQIVSPTGRLFPLQWSENSSGKFVHTGAVSNYPPSLAYARDTGERAESIVNRILLFLNTGVIS